MDPELTQAIGTLKEDITGHIGEVKKGLEDLREDTKALSQETSKFRTSLAITQTSLTNHVDRNDIHQVPPCPQEIKDVADTCKRIDKVEVAHGRLLCGILSALGTSVIALIVVILRYVLGGA